MILMDFRWHKCSEKKVTVSSVRRHYHFETVCLFDYGCVSVRPRVWVSVHSIVVIISGSESTRLASRRDTILPKTWAKSLWSPVYMLWWGKSNQSTVQPERNLNLDTICLHTHWITMCEGDYINIWIISVMIHIRMIWNLDSASYLWMTRMWVTAKLKSPTGLTYVRPVQVDNRELWSKCKNGKIRLISQHLCAICGGFQVLGTGSWETHWLQRKSKNVCQWSQARGISRRELFPCIWDISGRYGRDKTWIG